MAVNFNQAAVQAVFDGIVSQARSLGVFERVYAHEPKSAPGTGITLAVWWDSIDPYPRGSGLAAVSARVTFMARIYRSYMDKDSDDKIDPGLLTTASTLLGALSGAYTFGGAVRNVDLLGESGTGLSARAGYMDIDGKPFRATEITLPVIVNDVWTEAP